MTNIATEKRRSKGIRRRISSRVNSLSSSLSWIPPEDERRISKSVVVEDFVAEWNLDIESGFIEQEAACNNDDGVDDDDADDNTNKRKNKQTGCCRCFERMKTIGQDGGDVSRRVSVALRASLGSLTFFSAIIFNNPPYLGAVWIGTSD
jgi:uncharacterized membrane protein YkoI